MKREILKKKFENESFLKKEYPGEFTKVVPGLAKLDMVCDWSGEPIKVGDPVLAVSMGVGKAPEAVTWETMYVQPTH